MPKTRKRKYNFKKYKSGDPDDSYNPFNLTLNLSDVTDESEQRATVSDYSNQWINQKTKNGEFEIAIKNQDKHDLLSNTNFYSKLIKPIPDWINDYIEEHIFIKVPYKDGNPNFFNVYSYNIEDCNNSIFSPKYVCDGQIHPSISLSDHKNMVNPYSRNNKKETAKTMKSRTITSSPLSVYEIEDPISSKKRSFTSISQAGKKRKSLKRKKRKSIKRKNKK